MRRQVVAGPDENTAASVRNLLPQLRQLACQGVDLLLLANDDLVQLVELVFVEAVLVFQVGQAMVCGFGGFGGFSGLHTVDSSVGTRTRPSASGFSPYS